MKKRMIKLMTIFCMAGILTVNPVITGLAEAADAVGADASEEAEPEEEPTEEEAEEPETDAEEAAGEESDEAVTEEVSELENEPEADIQKTSEDSVENNQAVTTSTEENVPVVMDLLPNVVEHVEKNWNDNDSSPNEIIYKNGQQVGSSIKLNAESVTRSGYDLIGWYKNGIFLSGSDDQNYTYTFTEEDAAEGTVIFTAGWRQNVSLSVDGGEATPLEAGKDATAEQVSYDLSEAKEKLDVPSGSYEFADKWVVNGEGPYAVADDIMTVMFAQTDGNLVFNAVNVKVDGETAVSTNDNIKLTSCWNLVDGQYNLRIEDKTTGTLTANGVAAKDGIIEINNVLDQDDIEFKKGEWTLKKSVSDLVKGSNTYVEKDGKYYQYCESTIKDSDFEKTVKYTYQDDFTDTTFSNTGTGTATIHPGVTGQTWASILPANVAAERGKFQFAEWNYLLNGNEQISETTEIDFYNDNAHSLTVKPIWKGSYSYNGNAPEGETVTAPVGGSGIVNTEIILPTLGNITGKYTFEGWIDSDGNTYQAGASYTITEAEVTFTAQWNAVSYEVRFVDEDGTEYSKETVPYGNTYSWNRTPSKTGYTFVEWKLNTNNEVYGESGTIEKMPAQNLTFTAQWSINYYTISYDGNGATVGVPTDEVEQEYDSSYTIKDVVPTRTGYTFQGWSDGTTTYQPGAAFKVPAKNVVLTAQWKINSHQVKYDGNGGKTSAPASKSADYNSSVSVAAGLEKDGYVFEGWEQISTGKILAPGTSFVMPDMDETLKAKWKIAYTSITGKGTYYLVSGQSYTLGSGLKVQGDNSSYSGNMTFYVPQSGYYTFE